MNLKKKTDINIFLKKIRYFFTNFLTIYLYIQKSKHFYKDLKVQLTPNFFFPYLNFLNFSDQHIVNEIIIVVGSICLFRAHNWAKANYGASSMTLVKRWDKNGRCTWLYADFCEVGPNEGAIDQFLDFRLATLSKPRIFMACTFFPSF